MGGRGGGAGEGVTLNLKIKDTKSNVFITIIIYSSVVFIKTSAECKQDAWLVYFPHVKF